MDSCQCEWTMSKAVTHAGQAQVALVVLGFVQPIGSPRTPAAQLSRRQSFLQLEM